MWTCPYCGQNAGQPFSDSQLHGMLCLNPDCGRFHEMTDQPELLTEFDTHDL